MSSEQVEGTADDDLIDAVHSALHRLWDSSPGIGEEDRTLFTLAVSEIATNIVEHARAREPITVAVELSVDDEALRARFRDDADPSVIHLQDVSMPGEDAESGRGLALALATLDSLEHDGGSGGNEWRLARLLRRE